MIERPLNIFIASASEGLDVANKVRDALKSHTAFVPTVWPEAFKPSMTYIGSLEEELAQSDFAILTLTPDDQTESRGSVHKTPRDNILFELGLFMGRLGRERTYFLYDKNQDLKIPTDLQGVNAATYATDEGQNLEDAIAIACLPIAKRMRELGVRLKRTSEMEHESRLISNFCERVAGTWWGYQQGDEVRLGLLRIAFDPGANTVQLAGETFNRKGKLLGRWKSVAIGFQVRERTLFFSWQGTHPTISPGERFEGFGYYEFTEASETYKYGDGLFADIHMRREAPVIWKPLELRRVDDAELNRIAEVMKNGTDGDRASEILRALTRFTDSG